MTDAPARPVLTLSCPDQFGIVAAVAGYLAAAGCNIEKSAQHHDRETGLFFMRVEFAAPAGTPTPIETVRAGFLAVAARFEMNWAIRDLNAPVRALILASRADHCLIDLLHRAKRREINLDIRAVASNHPDFEDLSNQYGAPYHHLPVTDATRADQETALKALIEKEEAELIILARYMQVLSDDFCSAYPGRTINIHHSFLPSFKGARPYHRAFARGVKLIGATAHFVTPDLDEGPIIEQEVERVDHAMTPEDFIRIGRDVERRTLAQAVRWYCERRTMLNGVKTVTFR